MLRPALAATLFTLAACSPTFNWREVRAESMPLKAMLPCKPDKGARTVPMAGRQVELQVLGCEAGGATFALLSGDIVDPLRSGEVLAQWRAATLANLQATPGSAQDRPFLPAGAMALPQSLRVTAAGQRADGSKVESQAVYFARGSQVVQAVIYADQVPAEAADTFFAGLGFE
jgi:phage tail protein X